MSRAGQPPSRFARQPSRFARFARRRTAGFAIADFLCGTLILAGAVATWATLTRAQIDVAAETERRARALYAAEEALARFQGARGLSLFAGGAPGTTTDFALIERFEGRGLARARKDEPVGRLEARPADARGLASTPGEDPGAAGVRMPRAIEVRARLEWRGDNNATDRLEVSTLVIAPVAARAPGATEPKPAAPEREGGDGKRRF